jgi:hypothetical protein
MISTADGYLRRPGAPAAGRAARRSTGRGARRAGRGRLAPAGRLAWPPGGNTVILHGHWLPFLRGLHGIDLLPVLSFSAEMTGSPRARASPAPCAKPCCT